MVAGKPFSRIIRAVGVKDVWDDVEDLEVLSQLRVGPATSDDLIVNLHNYMTWEYDEEDLIITWVMTGEQTRMLYGLTWGPFKTGYFNIIISDTGETDARALVVPLMIVEITDTTTTSDGLL